MNRPNSSIPQRKFIVYKFIISNSNSHQFNILTFLRRATWYVWYANKHNETNFSQRHSVTSKPNHFIFIKYRRKHLDLSKSIYSLLHCYWTWIIACIELISWSVDLKMLWLYTLHVLNLFSLLLNLFNFI